MATTTNYAWETPDDTDLVKDGAAAIRTLGSSIDTTTKALNPSTTLGDIEYRSSTANTNTRLGIGSTGQVLTVSGGVPAWATPAGGGKILQVVQGTTTTETYTTSTTYQDSTLSATITPSSSSSKVLIMVTQFVRATRNSQQQGIYLKLLRGSTNIWEISQPMSFSQNTGSALELHHNNPITYLDSPATTSATTYKTQFKPYDNTNGGAATAQFQSQISAMILMEVGA